uniref:(northern house mosquito) hypothetical protein n=1 Tax=Culex pipiens TaxID=7175 RepID=A0A8D8C7Z8_CULPI
MPPPVPDIGPNPVESLVNAKLDTLFVKLKPPASCPPNAALRFIRSVASIRPIIVSIMSSCWAEGSFATRLPMILNSSMVSMLMSWDRMRFSFERGMFLLGWR